MRDFNFFRPYITKKKALKGYRKPLLICLIVFVIAGAGLFVWNLKTIYALNNQIHGSISYLSREDNLNKLKQYEAAKVKIQALDIYLNTVQQINGDLIQSDNINSTLLIKMNSAMPQEVFIQSLSVGARDISIQGVSKSRTAIAEYQHNLKGLNLFDAVFVENINTEQSQKNSYIFSVKCSLKGGSVNEVNK